MSNNGHLTINRNSLSVGNLKKIASWLSLDLLDSVKSLDVSPRVMGILERNKINDVLELVSYSEDDLARLDNCGHKTLWEIKTALRNIGFRFSTQSIPKELRAFIRKHLVNYKVKCDEYIRFSSKEITERVSGYGPACTLHRIK